MIGMGFEYTVLPDGSIFKLDSPKDFIIAAQIVQDEVGDMDGDGGDSVMVRPWVSMSACCDD